VEKGFARNTFTIPDDVREITIGLAFMYPMDGDYILINDIGFFTGNIDPEMLKIPDVKRFSHLDQRNGGRFSNLVRFEDISARCEKGVGFFSVRYDDTDYLIVRSTGLNDVSPAIYFTTVKVEPGQTYSYIVKARTLSKCRMALYVTGPKGNIVWPGSQVGDGFGKSTVQIPPDVNEITLGMAFVYPANNEYVLVESIGLFLGEVSPWKDWKGYENTGMQPLTGPHAYKNKNWQIPVMILFLLLPIVLLSLYKRNSKTGQA
jgi:hypothetical protein